MRAGRRGDVATTSATAAGFGGSNERSSLYGNLYGRLGSTMRSPSLPLPTSSEPTVNSSPKQIGASGSSFSGTSSLPTNSPGDGRFGTPRSLLATGSFKQDSRNNGSNSLLSRFENGTPPSQTSSPLRPPPGAVNARSSSPSTGSRAAAHSTSSNASSPFYAQPRRMSDTSEGPSTPPRSSSIYPNNDLSPQPSGLSSSFTAVSSSGAAPGPSDSPRRHGNMGLSDTLNRRDEGYGTMSPFGRSASVINGAANMYSGNPRAGGTMGLMNRDKRGTPSSPVGEAGADAGRGVINTTAGGRPGVPMSPPGSTPPWFNAATYTATTSAARNGSPALGRSNSLAGANSSTGVGALLTHSFSVNGNVMRNGGPGSITNNNAAAPPTSKASAFSGPSSSPRQQQQRLGSVPNSSPPFGAPAAAQHLRRVQSANMPGDPNCKLKSILIRPSDKTRQHTDKRVTFLIH